MAEKCRIIAYHCPNCGSVSNPEAKFCKYCGADFNKRFNIRKDKARLLVKENNDFVYFPLCEIEYETEYGNIDIQRTETGFLYRQTAIPYFTFKAPLTREGIESLRKIGCGHKEIRVELLNDDRAFEGEGLLYRTTVSLSVSEFMKFEMEFTPESITLFNTVVPKNTCCPNCGAEIKSQLGCCDYCGGWVEWLFY